LKVVHDIQARKRSQDMENQINEQEEMAVPAQKTEPQIDQFELENSLRKLKSEQNLGLGIVGGVVGMLVGAILWAIITAVTDYQIGYMAIGVGLLVGAGVRFFGKGFDSSFGFVGAVFALAGCVLGNVLAVVIIVAQEYEIPILDLLLSLDLEIVVEFLKVTFTPMDLLFYALAIYAGYRYAFRRVTREDLLRQGF
jgi:hypothetical protein